MSVELGTKYESDADKDARAFNEIVENLQDVVEPAEKIIGDALVRPLVFEEAFDAGPPICGSDSYSEVDEVEGGHDPE